MKSSESSEELKKYIIVKTLVNGNKKILKSRVWGSFSFLYEILFFTCKTTGNGFSFESFDRTVFFNQREQVLVHVFIPTRMSKSISVQVSRKVSS